MMDAAGIARLQRINDHFDPLETQRSRLIVGEVRSLINDLKHARKERDELADWRETWADEHGTTWRRPTAWAYAQCCRVRDAAQRDAKEARELAYEECAKAMQDATPHGASITPELQAFLARAHAAIHARIEAMLEKKL